MADEKDFHKAMSQLRAQFIGQLPDRLLTISEIAGKLDHSELDIEQMHNLHRLVHGLHGSAGTFGMHSLSEAARRAESLLGRMRKTDNSAEHQRLSYELSVALQNVQKLILDAPHTQAPSLKMPTFTESALTPQGEPLIFVVDDEPEQGEQLCQLLLQEGYRPCLFTCLAAFGEAIQAKDVPAAVIMDMVFPDGELAGAEFIRGLKQQYKGAFPPVLFLSMRRDLDARLAAYRSGSAYYLNKPVDSARLIRQLDELTLRMPKEPYRVLMVDDEELVLEAQATVLRAAGIEVTTLSDPRETLEKIESLDPEVLILDYHMPDITGPELAALLREDERYHQLPIVFISAELDEDWQLRALHLGGDDFLVKPVEPDYLVCRVLARARRSREYRAGRAQMQQLLYEREREHLALNQHAIVSIADRTGNITYVNDMFCEISGYSREELLGQNHRLLKSGQHAESFYAEMWASIASGQVWRGEVCNRRKDGIFYWVESSITPFLDDGGRPYQYVSIRTDISHVKAAEQEMERLAWEQGERVKEARALAAITEVLLDDTLEDDEVLDRTVKLIPSGWMVPEETAARICFGSKCFYSPNLRETPWRISADIPFQSDGHYEVEVFRLNISDEMEQVAFFLPEEKVLLSKIAQQVGLALSRRSEQRAQLAAREALDVARLENEVTKERLRRGQLFANIGTWEWNIVSGDLLWTERIAPLFGYPTGDLETSYDNFLAAVHPDDRQLVIDAVGGCVEHDKPYDIEHRVVWPDGTVRWLLERGAVQRDAEGKPLVMIGVVQDIDDRKRAELALGEREQSLRQAQSLACLGDWYADMHSGELYWSDVIYEIFGYQPGEVQPSVNLFKRAVHPDDLALVEESEQQARESGMHDVVHRIVRPDGELRYVHELATAELDAEGRLLGFKGTVQDVTELKQAEQDLLVFRRVFDTTEQGIGVTDADGYLLYSNPAHDTLHGYEHRECMGRHFTLFFSEQTMQWAPDIIMGAVAEGKSWSGLLPIKRKDGAEVMTASNVGFIAGADGKPQYLFNIMSDYGPELARQQQLAEAKEEAERASQAKSAFLSSMSHELRTPMNAILGFGQILEYDDALDQDQQDNVHEILKAGNHLLDLINEVLDLAKVESGQLSLSLEPVELCPVVEECLSLIQPLAQKRSIRIQHSGLERIQVRADRTRLKQVLLNLLSNAVKYNREGGEVNLKIQPEGSDRLRVLVSDTGKGIPGDRLSELFEPFNRLDAEGGEVEGTGIGLTITRRIMELMGGSIEAESEVGVGSTFWLELPLEDESQDNDADAQHDQPQQSTDLAERQHLVLYIEDNPANLKLVANILGKLSHIHLLSAHLPELGLELAHARKPDLILLDINMPGMDGYQVLQILKQNPELKQVPVVAVTANAMPRDIERGREAGFTDYVTKPIQIRQFLDAVERWLAQADEKEVKGAE